MKRLLITALLFIGVLSFSIASVPVTASAQAPGANVCEDSASWFLGLPTWYKYLEFDSDCNVTGPEDPENPDQIDWQKASGYIGLAVLEIMLRLAAMAAVAFVIYGGFRYITSQGEPDSAKAARQTIMNAVIGLMIALLSTAIVSFVARSLTS